MMWVDEKTGEEFDPFTRGYMVKMKNAKGEARGETTTKEGLCFLMNQKYGTEWATRALLPTAEEAELIREMAGIPDGTPAIIMCGEAETTEGKVFRNWCCVTEKNLTGFVKFDVNGFEMAATRAINRAMGSATGGKVSYDEIPDADGTEQYQQTGSGQGRSQPQGGGGTTSSMLATDKQRESLQKIAGNAKTDKKVAQRITNDLANDNLTRQEADDLFKMVFPDDNNTGTQPDGEQSQEQGQEQPNKPTGPAATLTKRRELRSRAEQYGEDGILTAEQVKTITSACSKTGDNAMRQSTLDKWNNRLSELSQEASQQDDDLPF